MSTTTARLAAIVAATLLTVATVSSMNTLASDTYRSVSEAQLMVTPMASAQQVTVTAHRSRA
jgi:hypothetical protein